MKEGMSVTTIFQIVILFILLFTAIMALTINNSNAFGMKDEIVNIIEQNNGNYMDGGNLNQDLIDTIAAAAYRTTGSCPSEDYIGYTRNGEMTSDNDAAVCIREVAVTSTLENIVEQEIGEGTVATGNGLNGRYYQIIVFYQLDIPVVKQIYNFQTKGETRVIYN